MIFPGGGGRETGAEEDVSDGWRECEGPVGEVGLAEGGWGCERKARCICKVGVRRVVASPERFREGKSRRECRR